MSLQVQASLLAEEETSNLFDQYISTMVTESEVIAMIMDDESISRPSKSIIIGDIVDQGINDWSAIDVASTLREYSDGFKGYTESLVKAKKILGMHVTPDLEIDTVAGNMSGSTDFDKLYLKSTHNMLNFVCSYVKVHSIVKDLWSER